MGKEDIGAFSAEVFEKLGVFIATAFGLVAAFAWREVFLEGFRRNFGDDPALNALIIYALLVSLIGIIATIAIAKASSKVQRFKKSESTKDHDIIR